MANQAEPKLDIRDPYIFEFLGIKPREVMRESDLEDALLDKLHDFLLELGHGFCFEARQKRILIGNTHGFVDMVFYHRILKCHVLVELKVESFTHENLGQLNTYVSWYRKNMMANGDNPPVGILLCTQKDHALVEYATAGMDNHLFVSKYQLELPKKEDIQRFLEEKMREDIGYGGWRLDHCAVWSSYTDDMELLKKDEIKFASMLGDDWFIVSAVDARRQSFANRVFSQTDFLLKYPFS